MKPKINYDNIPPKLLKRSKQYRRPPYGMCVCQRGMGELSGGGIYQCDKCKEAAAKSYDKAEYFGVSGSNIHRVTGKRVDTHALEEYPILTKNRQKSNNPNELLRYGKY